MIGDDPRSTVHPRIMKAHEEFLNIYELKNLLDQLVKALGANDVNEVRALLQTAVPGYQPDSQVADLIYCKINK